MALLEILTIAIGVVYGYLKPGKEDRKALLKKGLLIGIILALIFVGLGALAGGRFLLFGGALAFIEVIILAVLFIIGTFIGDWLEEKSKLRLHKALIPLMASMIILALSPSVSSRSSSNALLFSPFTRASLWKSLQASSG